VGYAPWTVILRAQMRIIGWGVEVAYFFAPAFWGQGYGTALVQVSLHEGFQRHGLPQINVFVHRLMSMSSINSASPLCQFSTEFSAKRD